MIQLAIVNDFANWLSNEINKREWRQTDLARKAGIGNSTLSRILDGSRPAGQEVCLKIARALGYPPEEVFRKAGLLPASPLQDKNETIQRLVEIVGRLSDMAQEEVLAYAEYRYQRQQQADPNEAIELLAKEIERLFSLLSRQERGAILDFAAQERYAREILERMSQKKRD